MTEPLIITVILNTNRREDTLACLSSLDRSTYGNNKTIVLDNASSDGSVAAIRAELTGKRGVFDFPTVDDGVYGMAFLETAVKSAASNAKWVKFPAV